MADSIFSTVYGKQQRQEEVSPPLGEILGGATRQYSGPYNLISSMLKPDYEPEYGYDYKKLFKESGVPEFYRARMASTRNAQEFEDVLAQIRQEEKDKLTVEAGGWAGTVAALAAGVIDPTILLPFAGQAKGLKLVAQTAALGAAQSALYEAELRANQETRTLEESFESVAMGTLLGGALGGIFAAFPVTEKVRFTRKARTGRYIEELPEVLSDTGSAKMVRRVTGDKDLLPEPVLAADGSLARFNRTIEGIYTRADLGEAHLRVGEPLVIRQSDGKISDEVAASLRAEGIVPNSKEFDQQVLEAGYDSVLFVPVRAGDTGKESVEVLMSREGTTVKVMGEAQVDKVGSNMAPAREALPEAAARAEMEVPKAEGQSLSAATVPKEYMNVERLETLPAFRRMIRGFFGHISPQYRATASPFATIRNAFWKMDSAGRAQPGLEKLQPSAHGGTVLSRIELAQAKLVDFLTVADAEYYKYISDGQELTNHVYAEFEKLKSSLNLVPPGKKTWAEFKQNVTVGAFTGKFAPEEAKTVKAFTDFFGYFRKVHDQYVDEARAIDPNVGPIFKVLEESDLEDGVLNYIHEIWSQERILDNMDEFLADFSNFAEGNLKESFARGKEKFQRQEVRINQEIKELRMSPEARASRLSEVLGQQEAISEFPEVVAYKAARKTILDQARLEGWEASVKKERLNELLESQPAEIQQSLTEAQSLGREAKRLSRFEEAPVKKIEKLAVERDKAAEKLRVGLTKLVQEAVSLERKEGASVASLGKKMAKAERQLEKVLGQLEAANASLAKLVKSEARLGTAARMKAAETVGARKAMIGGARHRLGLLAKEADPEVRLENLKKLQGELYAEATERAIAIGAKAQRAVDEIEEEFEKMLSPTQMEARAAELERELTDMEIAFGRDWSDKGAVGTDLLREGADFTEASILYAKDLMQKLTKGIPSPAAFDIEIGKRGPMLRRMLKVPFDMKQKYLELDPTFIARSYVRKLAPDLELWRAFGSINGQTVRDQLAKEADDLTLSILTSSHVKLPKGWSDKADSLVGKVKDRVMVLADPDKDYFDLTHFSNEAKEGYTQITPEIRKKLVQYVSNSHRAALTDFDVAIDRLRKLRMIPENPESFMYRVGISLKRANVFTMMGKVVPSSIPDLSRGIQKYGLERVMKTSWEPYITGVKNAAGKSFAVSVDDVNRKLAINLDVLLHGRFDALYDLAEGARSGNTLIERGIKVASEKTGQIALFDYWNKAMKNVASATSHSVFAEYIPAAARALASGKVEGDDLTKLVWMRGLGLRDDDLLRIYAQMEKPNGMETFSNGSRLPNVELWDDPAAFQAYAAALKTDVDRMILIPGLERPNWADQNLAYSMMAQFQSYAMAANSRIIISAAEGNDPYLISGSLMALALGAVSYYTNAISNGGEALEKANALDPQDWIYEAISRSGLTGLVESAQRVGEQIPALNQFWAFGGEEKPYRRPVGLMGAAFGPSMGQAEKIVEFIKNMDDIVKDNGEVKDARVRKNMKLLRQLFVPYQNQFLLKRGYDAIGTGLETILGVQE